MSAHWYLLLVEGAVEWEFRCWQSELGAYAERILAHSCDAKIDDERSVSAALHLSTWNTSSISQVMPVAASAPSATAARSSALRLHASTRGRPGETGKDQASRTVRAESATTLASWRTGMDCW